jgi:para-nitrobenzyl esterase
MRVDVDTGGLVGADVAGVARFFGIPFAAPATGPLQFRRPQHAQPWRGAHAALEPAAAPPQERNVGVGVRGATRIDTDCLYLNVFAPTAPGSRRPVFVWIFGGGFLHGDAADPLFDGAQLARREDLIVVTANYRLGIWGFAPLIERNVGVADQIAALQWIARNIAAFGGDPDNVTLAGESAGAMSVCNLLASPAARGLFHRAIAQSGAAGNVATREQADETARVVREELGVEVDQADLGQLLAAQRATLRRLRPLHHSAPLRPHVDGELLPVHPLTAAAAAADVPLIIGMNRDEYRLYIRSSLKLDDAALLAHLERRLREHGAADAQARAVQLLQDYRARPPDARNPNAALLADIETQLRFREPLLRYALARARNTWVYQFDWPSPALRGWLGATHAMEVPFVFGNFELPPIAKFVGAGPEATALSHQMMALWATFARHGRPPAVWPEFTATERMQLHLNRDIDCRRVDDDAILRRWSEVLQR